VTHPETTLISAGRPVTPGSPLNHPVSAASNYLPGGDLWYARAHGTETVAAFESVIGTLERGEAVAFSSGMAAVSAVLDLVPIGATVVRGRDLYHGVATLLAVGEANGRWKVRTAGEMADWFDEPADLLWVESPSNPLLEVLDLQAICENRPRDAVVAVDSTFATPIGQTPLGAGADFVVHSATKFIGGHSDLVAGVVVANAAGHVEHLRTRRELAGGSLGSLEAFLALRGLRTLGVRLERSASSAGELAQRLQGHGSVKRVWYPGLESHPTHHIAASQLRTMGAVLSFGVGDDALADRICDSFGLVVNATSLGGVETTAERRSGYPGSGHLPPGLIRMSVGLEAVDDLWFDLEAAISR